jgi:hypothetical protein
MSTPTPPSSTPQSWGCMVSIQMQGAGTYNGQGTCGLDVVSPPPNAAACVVTLPAGGTVTGWCAPPAGTGTVTQSKLRNKGVLRKH